MSYLFLTLFALSTCASGFAGINDSIRYAESSRNLTELAGDDEDRFIDHFNTISHSCETNRSARHCYLSARMAIALIYDSPNSNGHYGRIAFRHINMALQADRNHVQTIELAARTLFFINDLGRVARNTILRDFASQGINYSNEQSKIAQACQRIRSRTVSCQSLN